MHEYSDLFWSAFSRIWTEYGEIRSISNISPVKNTEYWYFLLAQLLFFTYIYIHISILIISWYLSTLTIPLSKRNQSDISSELLFFLWLFFVVISSKYKTWAIFDILMTLAIGINIINRQMNQFFQLLLKLVFISFLYFKSFKILVQRILPLHYVLVCIMKSYMSKMTLSSLLT